MAELSRTQIVVYAAVGVALLLVGARAIRGEGGTESSYAAGGGGGAPSGGSFSIGGESGDLVVDVTGAVRRPGVYRMPAGSRVDDAVTRAGGAAPRAELEAVNLAARLADGQQVVVPERAPAGGAAGLTEAGEDGPISLGTATADQLEEIDGIGPVTAADIIEFRDAHGGLSSVEQLARCRGSVRRRWILCAIDCSPRMRSPRPSLPVLVGIALLVVLALAHSGEIRDRASAGLGRGMPSREAELARGFVLGEDDHIDEGTKEDFRRSGLSHLLAVSGENVTLLALLAMPLLGALGIPLRERLLWVLGLITVYVPVAGAGPSVQRAGVMGAVGLVATLSGRRSSRLYALALAALVTLGIAPSVARDIGWQLSFAAVLGILLLASPLREAVLGWIGSGRWRRALAEALAVTVAATLATAPLIAYHFEELSTTTLLANVLAMPAVAPAMWLGMCSAGLAQVPGLPLEPLNGLGALLLAYVAQVAAWCAAPDWAELHVQLDGGGLIASYLGLGAIAALSLRLARARRLAASRRGADGRPRLGISVRRTNATARAAIVASVGGLLLLAFTDAWGRDAGPPPAAWGLRVDVLDVGQGDAILLQPRRAPAILVDGGPPGDHLAEKLEDAGVDELGAAVITHDQSDHAAGIEELLGRFPVARLLYGRLDRRVLERARAAGVVPQRLAAGREVHSGALRLRVLWPPPELLGGPAAAAADPNQLALVTEARWHRFKMLLTADAEAESVPLDPGPIDVLKVAHHGSDDAGLDDLLDRSRPKLAVISVGDDNPYGHPTSRTLHVLDAHGVRTLRTDRDGDVVIDVSRRAFSLDG
jgi:competence protein ComEC